ncbi:MAG: hypothetical protein AAGI30_06865 [Planctomycetota bacterium]
MTSTNPDLPERDDRHDDDLFAPLDGADDLLFETHLDSSLKDQTTDNDDLTARVLSGCERRRCWLSRAGCRWLMGARVAVVGVLAGVATAAFIAERHADPAPEPLTIQTPAATSTLELAPVSRMFRIADDGTSAPPVLGRSDGPRQIVASDDDAGVVPSRRPRELQSFIPFTDASELLAVLEGERLPELLIGGSSTVTGRAPAARRTYSLSRWVIVEVDGGLLLLDERTGELQRLSMQAIPASSEE